ncbi:FAD-dependent oxidoreductase [Albimonas sp. CAU 1670]|uniref:FAD-dependent oxidoreductase n=1 Tax=Albimonas sp. CAU 1670 TaxID=3032599 RepID=UPI0023DBF70F|nr:FAD-dependent oxidoreductase [Albimonas sp. CAU 1670]MDF2234891.1 FAD-dependent oxidoreductase [Albimonas sp. CAU 1670]
MGPRVIVVGAGVVGAACAWALAAAGARVAVVEAAAAPGLGCSAHSFGWLNLSVASAEDDLALRAEALALARRAPGFADRRGALTWADSSRETEALFALVRPHAPTARLVEGPEAAALAPELAAPPPLALFSPDEGAIEPAEAAAALLAAARGQGAETIFSRPVLRLALDGDRVAGVDVGGPAPERLAADHVVLAAGAASAALLGPLDPDAAAALSLSPSVLVRVPAPRPLSRILCGPELEARAGGRGAEIVMAEDPPQAPDTLDALAARRAEAMRRLLHPAFAPAPGAPARAVEAARPMPATRPLAPLSTAAQGLTLAFAHPGVIFAPLLAARVAERIVAQDAAGAA